MNHLLESLSVTENSVVKHKELDIEWLENELECAKDVIDQVQKRITNGRTNSNENSEIVHDDWIVIP